MIARLRRDAWVLALGVLFVLILLATRAIQPSYGGGDFGSRFGGLGHASHQIGLDVDVYYPRLDRLERAPLRPAQVDRVLAQALVDRFVAVGAQYVFVGTRVGLRGPRRVVQAIPLHNNHLHVRLRP